LSPLRHVGGIFNVNKVS